MANEHLATYLNDHLAAAVAAFELLEHLERDHGDTPAGAFAASFRPEIAVDRDELTRLADRLGAPKDIPRRAAAWLGERALQLKLHVDDPSDGALRRFESLEAVALGVDWKGALWRALAAVAPDVPELQGVDYDHFIQRNDAQRARVEPIRLEAARDALREHS